MPEEDFEIRHDEWGDVPSREKRVQTSSLWQGVHLVLASSMTRQSRRVLQQLVHDLGGGTIWDTFPSHDPSEGQASRISLGVYQDNRVVDDKTRHRMQKLHMRLVPLSYVLRCCSAGRLLEVADD